MEEFDLPLLSSAERSLDAAGPSLGWEHASPAAAANAAEREKTQQFVNALCGVTGGIPGMLRVRPRKRKHDVLEGEHWPFPHQRKCAKRLLSDKNLRMLVCHDAGMGKTFTFLLAVAGIHRLRDGRRPRVLVTAPASCLVQWKAAVLDCLRISERRVLVCNQLAILTRDVIKSHDFIIVSRDIVGRAFGALFEPVQAGPGSRRTWQQRPDVPPLPLLEAEFDILGVDEAHAMRNTQTACTQGHRIIAKKSARVIALTASPIFNSPTDLAGISLACDFCERFTHVQNWFVDAKRTRVNIETVSAFQVHVDRASEDVLNLPPLISETKLFDVCFSVSDDARCYNAILNAAKKLLRTRTRRGSLQKEEAMRLDASVLRLQQMAVSPLLEELGAVAV